MNKKHNMNKRKKIGLLFKLTEFKREVGQVWCLVFGVVNYNAF